MFAAERALRIWIDPAKLVGYGLSVDEVNKAIAAQNMQVSGGSTGEQPSPSEQEITASIMVEGQLSSIPEFEAIVLRANPTAPPCAWATSPASRWDARTTACPAA